MSLTLGAVLNSCKLISSFRNYGVSLLGDYQIVQHTL